MTTKQLNAEIPLKLDKELALFCVENNMKKKEVVEMAIKHFIAKADKEV